MKIKPGYFECDIERTNFVLVSDHYIRRMLYELVPLEKLHNQEICEMKANGFVCTRIVKHSGLHVAHSGGKEVLAVWTDTYISDLVWGHPHTA